MALLVPVMAAVLSLALAIYVQWRIPVFTRGGAKTLFVRVLLLMVGAAFGLTAAQTTAVSNLQVPVFLIGFGFVHVPAAAVLMLKHWRGEGRS